MSAKTILITGSTSGIGLAGAEELGRLGWRVLVHARSESRGQPVLEKLKVAVPTGNFELVTGDLSSLTSVATLADQVKSKIKALDVLWNNAGGLINEHKLSADGIELQMAVNHLAPFALTKLLLPLVEKAEQGRVIATSSMAHAFAKVNFDSWFADSDKKYRPFGVYSKTKLANVLFTQELARRLGSTKAIAQSFHPGWVRTGFGSGGKPQEFNAIVFFSFLALPPEKGADTGIFLATAAEPGTSSGLYWAKRKVRKASNEATAAHAKKLWDESEQIVERVLGKV